MVSGEWVEGWHAEGANDVTAMFQVGVGVDHVEVCSGEEQEPG